jgi:pyruvate/2-oxoglutarate dehydrogenase complex dihydrolipoamide acyltransferase (E2) component
MDEERHDAPRRPATERADELLTRVGQTAGIFASLVGMRVARVAAFAREEAEDMWAEARSMRQQTTHAETNRDARANAGEGTDVSEQSRSEAEEREPGEDSEIDGEAENTTPEAEEQETDQRAETNGEVDDIEATEAARRRAEELDVDLGEVEGTGSKGQITVQDVKKAAESES